MDTQGKRIKYIRMQLGLSQDEFGKKLKVSKQYVSNLEADRNILNNEKLVLLLTDLNVNINFILDGIGEPFIQLSDDKENRRNILNDIETVLRNHGL